MASSFGIRITGEEGTRGPFSAAEVTQELKRYREEHPEDKDFDRLTIWEMQEGTTVGVGKERDAGEFLAEE